MAQPYLSGSNALRSAPDGALPPSGTAAVGGILLGIAISLPLWAFLLWLLF